MLVFFLFSNVLCFLCCRGCEIGILPTHSVIGLEEHTSRGDHLPKSYVFGFTSAVAASS